MKRFRPWLLTCPIALLLMPFLLFAQLDGFEKTKEKIYIHTNNVLLHPGDGLFFKMYLVNAKTNQPSLLSQKIYVDILAPSGNLLEKQAYNIDSGFAEGFYGFSEAAEGGVYKLKAYTHWMQNETDSTFFSKEITLQKVLTPRVLMKLEFPQKGYGAGDEVTADFSMRSLNDQPIANKTSTYTVSIAGRKIATSIFTTNVLGKAQIHFKLPDSLHSNDGLLNITVKYEAYTESISRSIPIVLHLVDLQFMPEGGSFINGISTTVAFKAIDEKGKPVDVKGHILDANGVEVATFESLRFGMGKFVFVPKNTMEYTAKITIPANITADYKLPKIKSNGVVLNFEQNNEGLFALLKCSENSFGINIELAGETKGGSIYTIKRQLAKAETRIKINEKLFPMGITRFTVTSYGTPLAERLVFMNSEKNIHATITTDKKMYLPREKVKMQLKTVDENGKPVEGNFSVSVVDDKLWSYADDKQDHILSWLLLSSELRGKVEEPQFYFKQDEPLAKAALDLVMMTNGYRYFDFTEYVKTTHQPNFLAEHGVKLAGSILDINNKPIQDATVCLVNESNKILKIHTDDKGAFCFNDLPKGKISYLYAITKDKDKQAKIKLENATWDEQNRRRLLDEANDEIGLARLGEPNPKAMLMQRADEKAKSARLAKYNKGKHLDEVVVISYANLKKRDMVGSVARINKEEIEELPIVNIDQALAGRIAGLQLAPKKASPNIVVRGNGTILNDNAPLFVLDGMPVNNEAINDIDPKNIIKIDILKNADETKKYGKRGANGVVLISTKELKMKHSKLLKNLYKNTNNACLTVITPPDNSGITVVRKFYAPVYNTMQTEERSDFRENIYWNPLVQTNKDGVADIEWYNSDATTTFRAIAEGTSTNGLIGRTEATYAVQNALALDAKIPPYLTVGDKVLIPLNLKNNTSNVMILNIDKKTSDGFIIGKYTDTITLEKGEAKQILIPLEATNPVVGTIKFTATSNFGKEKLVLPIEAAEKGFAVTVTSAGTESGKFNIPINNMIPGSLKTELKVFHSIEGQLLDGIESMLREPHGCFEQTSSSTYPNIFVLKYLKESGKSNPEIEKKAMQYIQDGYHRLIGFETKENGFEWFGKAPAHEALTAYGLLEFTDMKDFVEVDKKMLERTKEFLLKRRDGNGGFQIKSGGYDQFASVPGKISNIYIVYALTQAGIGNEILPEYKAAVSKAIESKDAYQLAMMAIAASNMKDAANYAKLMALLGDSFASKDLFAETSVVNSRDLSLKIESMSLYVLALAREQKPDFARMATLLSKIVSSKTNYGYGSTQATVLALNAIVTYSKLINVSANGSQPIFTLNKKEIKLGDSTAYYILKQGDNIFTSKYPAGAQAAPYSFQVSYQTYTPPNSAKAALQISTTMSNATSKVGETVRMTINVSNKQDILQPMAIAKIGIPAGLSLQTWQLKSLTDKQQVAYYELFDNYLVLYWMGFSPNETKTIGLDLKAEVPGTYKAKASNTYLYYTPEYKQWHEGLTVEVKE